jgi:hypothetical protein
VGILNCKINFLPGQRLRARDVSHTGMIQPLGHSQVLPYVEDLARAGFRMDIVAFEPQRAIKDEIRAVEVPNTLRNSPSSASLRWDLIAAPPRRVTMFLIYPRYPMWKQTRPLALLGPGCAYPTGSRRSPMVAPL